MTAGTHMIVRPADTARALGSGDVEVLGTPRLIALCEQATVAAAATRLAATETSVGVRVEFDHLHPSLVGATVTATAVLLDEDGRRMTFAVEAAEDGRCVGRGTIVRAVVDRARFGAASGP